MGTDVQVADMIETATAFANAYAVADYAGVEAQLDPNVRYREITPRWVLEATGPAAILDEERDFLARYDRHETLQLVVERLGDRVGARTRWRLYRGEETEVVEWCEYMTVRDGRVTKLDAVCSGPMPGQ